MTKRTLTLSDRRMLAKLYLKNVPIIEIARAMGFSRSAIYYELDKGCTGVVNVNGKPDYDPDAAQKEADVRIHRRGRKRRLLQECSE